MKYGFGLSLTDLSLEKLLPISTTVQRYHVAFFYLYICYTKAKMFMFWGQFWSLETFLDYSHFGGKWASVQFLVLSYFTLKI